MKKTAINYLIAIISGFTIPFISLAQGRLSDTLQLDEVVVTATKTQVNRNNVPLTVSVINEEQIEMSSESALLPVLSEQVPGVFITERGITGFGVAAGSAGSINIRGIGGSPNTQNLVLLNGNPQFMGLMGHPIPDAYVASDVERVEIIRGPASTLYGSNAMGGVVNIITRQQKEDGFKANARLMYGSFNTQKYMANGGFRKKGFHAFASFNHDQTDGHRDSSDFSITNGYLKMGYDFSKKLSLVADLNLAGFKASDPGMETGNAGERIDITRGMGSVALDNQLHNINGSLRFFYNFGEHNITDGFHSNDINYGIVAYQTVSFFEGNSFTLGVDYKQFGGMAENIFAMKGEGITLGDTTISELAGYAFLQQRLFSSLVFNAGFRLEHNNVYGLEPVPSGGIAWNISALTTLKASVAKGFRSPTIRELYLFTPANADLKPERMVNYEAGIIQKFIKNKLSVELTAFKAHGDNLIKVVMGDNGPKNQNTGEFSNTGIELAGRYHPVDKLNINLNYSYISMEQPIIATPEQQLYVSGAYEWNKLSLSLSMQHIKNLYTDAGGKNKESYTLYNARAMYTLNKHLDIFIKGENLSNTKYYINFGYPMPRFTAFGGINVHL